MTRDAIGASAGTLPRTIPKARTDAEIIARLGGARNNRDMAAPQENMNLDMASLRIAQSYDIFFGGLQGPLKFPNPLMLEVLWRAFLRTGMPQFSQLFFTTLDGILFGGVFDHIGGGFFRHAADERGGSHFEKTRYDNAQMIEFTQIFSSTATNCAASESPKPSASCCAR